MRSVLLVAAACLVAQVAFAQAPAAPSVWRVADFGAKGDGAFDNTAAFQAALDAAGAAQGGTVEVPTGRYHFAGTLSVPVNVVLRGTFAYAPSHAGIRDKSPEKPVYGSVLEPCAGAGKEDGAPFILLNSNATLQGFCVHYTEQDPQADTPKAYPYAVAMRGNNPAIIDVELLNPYNGIDATQNQRALVRNVHGQPIHIGIYVNDIYDIGRIENVHWNPWWTMNSPIYRWQTENGIGFLFGRTDWHYVINTFCFGYSVGYKFIETKQGATNGNFLGIGADDCRTAVLIEESAPYGILITNGEFVAFHGPDPVMIRVAPTHTGTVRFNNCAFWGPAHQNAVVEGFGTIGFSDCTFMQWGHPGDNTTKKEEWKNDYAIEALGGSILVRGCEFIENKPQVYLGKDVQRAVITENLLAGKKRIKNDSRGHAIVKDNASTPMGSNGAPRRDMLEAPGARAHFLREK